MDTLNELKQLEYKTLYWTLFLNSLFRHPKINQRLQLFVHKMGVT